MVKNMGTIDRTVRVLVALVVGSLIAGGQIAGTAAVVLGLFAVIFLLTSAVGFCPLYYIVKFSTLKKGTA